MTKDRDTMTKTISNRTMRDSKRSEPAGSRIRFVPVIGGAVLLLGYLAFRASNSSPASASSDPVNAAPPQSVVVAKRSGTEPAVVPVDPVLDPAVGALPAQAARENVPSAVAQEVIARVGQLDFFAGGLSPQKTEELKRSFKQLVEEGAGAVPAIRAYLDRFQDIDFDPFGAAKQVGYPSLRMGMLDALRQIGTPEALELSLQTLHTTADPQEIAFLAKGLERQLPPDQFRSVVLAAASESLEQALSGQWSGRNVTPLFEVLQRYGDEGVIGLLEKASSKWNFYATLALAGMPNGAGIPALVRMVQDQASAAVGNGDLALRPLAQAALQFPQARASLLEQARLNQVPEKAWSGIAASFLGNYIQYGNQLFGSTAPAVMWSKEQIDLRFNLIDQMIAVTTSPTGKQVLQNAQAQMLSRLPKS
ncbi:MAG TPA: hypothetical protein VNU68_08665 [Verrucomicrobiae bacterium]|nr:hypothetical protein [Verrucomicrobiae bacterium]